MGAAHFSFTVGDIERSKRFYGEMLQLPLLYEMRHQHPYTSRQVGYEDADLLVAAYGLSQIPGHEGGRLELIEYVHPRGETIDVSTKNVGSAHLAFVVDDIHAEYARLCEHGVRFRSEPVFVEEGVSQGAWTVYLRDPDEITLELVQPAPRGVDRRAVVAGTRTGT
jgi:lactoylglutathione lyase